MLKIVRCPKLSAASSGFRIQNIAVLKDGAGFLLQAFDLLGPGLHEAMTGGTP
jgi:hypothetical protein